MGILWKLKVCATCRERRCAHVARDGETVHGPRLQEAMRTIACVDNTCKWERRGKCVLCNRSARHTSTDEKDMPFIEMALKPRHSETVSIVQAMCAQCFVEIAMQGINMDKQGQLRALVEATMPEIVVPQKKIILPGAGGRMQ